MPEVHSPMPYTQSWGTLTPYTAHIPREYTANGLDDFASLLSDYTIPQEVIEAEDPYAMATYGYTKAFHIEDAMESFRTLSPVDSVHGISTIDPASIAKKGKKHTHGEVPWSSVSSKSSSSPSVSQSNDQCCQKPGQSMSRLNIAPHSSITPSPKQVSPPQDPYEKEVAKQNGRIQRARNAANKRHSMSKASRANDQAGNSIGGSPHEAAEDPKLLLNRERNRSAAAKCRAKSKKDLAELKVRYDRESTRHNQLESSLLELRNMLTTLRDCSLQHSSLNCKCNSLHQYNDSQARKVVRDFDTPGTPFSWPGTDYGSV